MVCKKCKDAFKWLDSLGQHYQPIYGFEDEYVDKGKIKPERVVGFEEIKVNLLEIMGNVSNKKILDIGSNLGWFCFELQELGAFCLGLDIICKRIEVCEAVKDKMGLKAEPKFECKNAIEFVREYPENEWDYVLLLNTFHHILLGDEDGAWEMFNTLLNHSRGVIIMMRSKYKQWQLRHTKNIPQSILEQSEATHFKSYGRVHGRVIYHFWKDDTPEPEPERLTVSTGG